MYLEVGEMHPDYQSHYAIFSRNFDKKYRINSSDKRKQFKWLNVWREIVQGLLGQAWKRFESGDYSDPSLPMPVVKPSREKPKPQTSSKNAPKSSQVKVERTSQKSSQVNVERTSQKSSQVNVERTSQKSSQVNVERTSQKSSALTSSRKKSLMDRLHESVITKDDYKDLLSQSGSSNNSSVPQECSEKTRNVSSVTREQKLSIPVTIERIAEDTQGFNTLRLIKYIKEVLKDSEHENKEHLCDDIFLKVSQIHAANAMEL